MTINGTDVVDPYDVQITRNELASLSRSIDGTQYIESFDSTLDKNISIACQWRVITANERNTLKTQLEGCISTARAVVFPDGNTSYSLRLNPETPVVETIVRVSGGWRYNVQVSFVGVI
jgi:hypothetical protein